jgi:hypothetical protein
VRQKKMTMDDIDAEIAAVRRERTNT